MTSLGRYTLGLAVLVVIWAGGAGPGVPTSAEAHAPDEERGKASWYGHPYHGRHASNGEIYDMHKLTAAHRTLPLGTRVRVINLRNGRSVEVRITDRGPFVRGRIIDLSYAAARRLDMVKAGVVPVRVRVIALPGAARERRVALAGVPADSRTGSARTP